MQFFLSCLSCVVFVVQGCEVNNPYLPYLSVPSLTSYVPLYCRDESQSTESSPGRKKIVGA